MSEPATVVTDLAAWLTQIWDEWEPNIRMAIRTGEHGVSQFDLDRIAADRKILAWCTERERVYVGTLGDDPSDPKNYVPGALRHSTDSVVVRLLALPYADWPGYQEDWRPA